MSELPWQVAAIYLIYCSILSSFDDVSFTACISPSYPRVLPQSDIVGYISSPTYLYNLEEMFPVYWWLNCFVLYIGKTI